MPTLEQARGVPISNRYRINPEPVAPPRMNPQPIRFDPTPPHLVRSPVMLSSMPYMATDTDNITRQFYNGKNLPTRRLIV